VSPDEAIAAIRTRLAEVDGPWVVSETDWRAVEHGPGTGRLEGFAVADARDPAIATFIAGAPEDVARLLTVAQAAVRWYQATQLVKSNGLIAVADLRAAVDALGAAVAGLGDGVPE
jgi:hypothetical protein